MRKESRKGPETDFLVCVVVPRQAPKDGLPGCDGGVDVGLDGRGGGLLFVCHLFLFLFFLL